jgi:hypothetical protein
MKNVFAVLLTLCLITVVVPPVSEGDDGDYGISTCEYVCQYYDN